MRRPPVIAIDGPTASGKGTLAKRLARHFGFAHLDTGALYRAIGLAVLKANEDPHHEQAALAAARTLDMSQVVEESLRNDAVANAASIVAALPAVRAAIWSYQQDFINHPPGGAPGAVLDGRDTGTVICPDAEVKLFVTASLSERARRRSLELRGRGLKAEEAEIRADIEARDLRDTTRAVAPLRVAPEAHLLDTSTLDIDAAFAAARAIVDRVLQSERGTR